MTFNTKQLIATSVLAATFVGPAQADLFDGGGDGTSWEDPLNWAADIVPLNNTTNILIDTNFDVVFDADTWAALTTAGNLQSPTEHRIARLLMGERTTGAANGTHSLTMDQGAGNTVRATNSSTGAVGSRTGKHSTLNILSGITNIEAGRVVVGNSVDSSGTINISAGELILGRGGLELGLNGVGTLNITGGSFTNRDTVDVFGGGTFHVAGSGVSEVGVGSEGSLDGVWTQAAGGVLRTGLDAGGVTPILVDDVGDDGAGLQGNATFASGSILDPYDLGGTPFNTWFTVMTWEGTLTDNGLALSTDSVLAGWEMQVVGNDLQVQLTPEPGSIALLSIGALAMIRRRKA